MILSYALALTAHDPRLDVHFLSDCNLVIARGAFVPATAPQPDLAKRVVAFLPSEDGQRLAATGLQLMPIRPVADIDTCALQQVPAHLRSFLPIRLGAGLLTCLDARRKENFLSG